MPETIDLTIPENIEQQLIEILTNLLKKKENKKTSELFLNLVKDLKPQNCVVKTGWVEGRYLSVDCKCKKNGSNQLIPSIVQGMQRKEQDMYFLFGLKPNVFHFDQDLFFEDDENIYFGFKLIRDV